MEWLLDEDKTDDPTFRRYFKCSRESFQKIVRDLTPRLTADANSFRADTVQPCEAIGIALHVMCHKGEGDTTADVFARGSTTVFKHLDRFCEAVIDEYGDRIRLPTIEEIGALSTRCMHERGLPGCPFAVDGKFFEILTIGGEANLKNHRKYSSVLNVACADIDYRFRWTSDMWEGGAGDARVWNASEFKRMLDTEQWPVGPLDEKITLHVDQGHGRTFKVPVWVAADSAFPQSPHLVKPFPGVHLSRAQQLFNNRHSSVRQTIEQAWGYLAGYVILIYRVCK